MPTVVGVGVANAATTTGVTYAWPVGYTATADDIGMLFISSQQTAGITMSSSGWANVTNSPRSQAANSNTINVYWIRLTGGEAAPVTNGASDFQTGFTIVFRGVRTAGNPWDYTPVAAGKTSSTTWAMVGGTTTVADCLWVGAISGNTDTATDGFAFTTSGNLTNVTEQEENWSALGNGGGIAVYTGEKASAGAVGTIDGSASPTSNQSHINLALVGAAAGPNNGSATGTVAWAGSVTGARASSGAASGAVAWVGGATGSRTSAGSATGAVSWVGSAAGARVSSGSASGAVAWSGSATGARGSSGSASGTVAWVGSATGEAPAGAAPNEGAATGTVAWVGSATGARVSAGAVSGTVTWAGSATGARVSAGSTTGTVSWVGSASGARVSAGATTGTVTWAGSATGTNVTPGPTGLMVSVVGDTELSLDWDDYTGALAYDIERDGSVVHRSLTSTWNDTGLSPGTQYCYRVRAVTGP
jgi:hypothetical protein